jgi:hypothetical protein
VVAAGGEFDEEGYLREDSRSVRIKLQRRLRGADALEVVNRLRKRALADGYSNLRVKFKRDAGNTRTVDVPTIREDAGDVRYVRYERVSGFERAMEQSVGEIRADMIEKMLRLLDSVRAGQQ